MKIFIAFNYSPNYGLFNFVQFRINAYALLTHMRNYICDTDVAQYETLRNMVQLDTTRNIRYNQWTLYTLPISGN